MIMPSFCKESGTAKASTNAGDIPAAGAIREARASHAALAELREQLVCAYRGGHPILLQGGGTCAFYGNPYRFRGEEIAGGVSTGFVPDSRTVSGSYPVSDSRPASGSYPVSGSQPVPDGRMMPDGGDRVPEGSTDTARPAPVMLDCRRYAGVVSYDPSELVVTARCGTPLAELEALLAEQGQCLPFDPPHFAPGRTVGGMVATGLSGPRRLSAGAVRDFVLGTVLLAADGSVMRFGGEVMKNVAGYDMSRLLCGSLGMLGMIAEVSLKVMPVPRADATLRLEMTEADALAACNRWGGQPLPLAATCWYRGVLHVRLCGARRAVDAACRLLGGEAVDTSEADAFWRALRDQHLDFFTDPARKEAPLWRLSVPSSTSPLDLSGEQLIEWGGALRWWRPPLENGRPVYRFGGRDHAWPGAAAALRHVVARERGSATLFRAGPEHAAGACAGAASRSGAALGGAVEPSRIHAGVERFHPLDPVSLQIHQRLKQAFDPRGLINPGRMYTGL
jgi:FAD/FMN-containing dehydrogenases